MTRKADMRRRCMIPILSISMMAMASPREAWAQSAGAAAPIGVQSGLESARALARKAMEHYQAGRFEEASAGFRDADAVYAAPQYRLYQARASAKLGKLVSAARAYDRAMALPVPDGAPGSFAEAQKTAAAELAEIRKRVPAIHISVTGAQVGQVKITLDGEGVPQASWERIDVDPGSHIVVVAAAGYESITRTLDLKEGVTEKIEAALKAVTAPAPAVAVAPPIVSMPIAPPKVAEHAPRKSVLIAGVTVTGAAFITGTALAIASAMKASTASGLFSELTICPTAGENVGGKCGDLIAAHESRAALGSAAIAAFIGVGVVGGATMIYGLSTRRSEKSAVRVSPGIGGVVVDGAF